MDVVNLKDEIALIEASTLPKLLAMGKELIAQLDAIVGRLDGATIQITINLRSNENAKDTGSTLPAACHEPDGPGADA